MEQAEQEAAASHVKNVSYTHADFDEGSEAAAPPQNLVEAESQSTVRNFGPKVGRNDPCPCGSGKKYKQCHGKLN